MFVARAWRVRTRPMGTQCLCVVGIMVCGPISYSPRQTFRPYGTIPSLYDCATNVPSRWDGFLRSTIVLQTFRPYGTVPPMLNDCYKHFVPTGRSPDVERIFYNHSVPLGRFPRLYDCATNV